MNEHNDNAEMFAACPHCHAVFRLTSEKLNFKDGLVRCGACREIFNANWNRVEKVGEGFAAVESDESQDEFQEELASLSDFERHNPLPKEYTVEPDSEILFDKDNETKWDRAVKKLGIDPSFLTGDAGHA